MNVLNMIVFTYSTFANNKYISTQLGYIILLADNTARANVLHCSIFQSERVVRLDLRGETYAFLDGFDASHMPKDHLEVYVRHRIPLTMLTDYERFFNVIMKASVTSEKQFMTDIMAARQAYDRG